MNFIGDLCAVPSWFDQGPSSRISIEERQFLRSLKMASRKVDGEVSMRHLIWRTMWNGYRPEGSSPRIGNTAEGVQIFEQTLSKTLALQTWYEERGFYGFLHSNKDERAPLAWTRKALEKISNPSRDLKAFTFLRPPTGTASQHMEDLLKVSEIDDIGDLNHRNDLLSVSGDFLHDSSSTSAASLCIANFSMYPFMSQGKISRLSDCEDLFQDIPCATTRQRLIEEFEDIINEFGNQTHGNLFAIFIPKEKVQKFAYRSHCFGVVCRCAPASEDLAILEKFQKHQPTPGLTRDCRQHRIWAYLKPEDGVRIFLIPPDPESARKCKARCKALAEKIVAAKQLQVNVHAKALGIAGAIFLGSKLLPKLLTIANNAMRTLT